MPPTDADLLRWRARVRDFLDQQIEQATLPGPLRAAIRYGSTEPEASRWRAILVLQIGELLDLPSEPCLTAAVAIEALHCATLCLDDLPCMDDAMERRGQAAVHQRYNEAIAIQSALWLLGMSRTLMIRSILRIGPVPLANPGRQAAVLETLVERQQATENALQLGQFMDVMGSLGKLRCDAEEVGRLKSARLFALAAQVPAWLVLDGLDPTELADPLGRFGESVGLAYQALDDLNDAAHDSRAQTWDREVSQGRPTFLDQYGRAGAEQRIEQYSQAALAALEPLTARGIDTRPLQGLTVRMLQRSVERSPRVDRTP